MSWHVKDGGLANKILLKMREGIPAVHKLLAKPDFRKAIREYQLLDMAWGATTAIGPSALA